MPDTFNVYLDESCHLENDGIPSMVLGSVWCPLSKTGEISSRVQEIKRKHNFLPEMEIKWTKVSTGALEFYRDLVNLFFDDDDLHFRGVIIPDKGLLDHEHRQQDHHDWYYKMCFTLLEPIILPDCQYRIYLDIKDTHSHQKSQELHHVLCNHRHDFGQRLIERVQPIRSDESPVLQLADLLLGAIGYKVRGLATNDAKLKLIQLIERRRRGWPLEVTSWLRDSKFNVLSWKADEGGR